MSGSLPLGTADVLGFLTLLYVGCPVPCRMVCRILASAHEKPGDDPSGNSQKCLQMWPDFRGKTAPVGNHGLHVCTHVHAHAVFLLAVWTGKLAVWPESQSCCLSTYLK